MRKSGVEGSIEVFCITSKDKTMEKRVLRRRKRRGGPKGQLIRPMVTVRRTKLEGKREKRAMVGGGERGFATRAKRESKVCVCVRRERR